MYLLGLRRGGKDDLSQSWLLVPCLSLHSSELCGSVPCTTSMLWSTMSWASALGTSWRFWTVPTPPGGRDACVGNWGSSLPTTSRQCCCEGTVRPRGFCSSCSSDVTGTEKEYIFPGHQDIHCFLFCLNLLAIDLLKWWYEREPFEEEIFYPFFHSHEGEEAKILDCSLRLYWVLPALSPL